MSWSRFSLDPPCPDSDKPVNRVPPAWPCPSRHAVNVWLAQGAVIMLVGLLVFGWALAQALR